MTKLTEKEIQQECDSFKNYLEMPVPAGINEYKKNEYVSKTLAMNVDFISSALLAWIARAEIAKGNK